MKKEPVDLFCHEELLKAVPEIIQTKEYQEVVDYFKDCSAGFIYESALLPYVIKLIQENPKDKKLDNIFDMIERIIKHDDFDIRCVAKVEFIEPFLLEIKPTKDVEKYLRPKSLAAARELARKWFKIDPDTWEATD